jgi:hypothetical protein
MSRWGVAPRGGSLGVKDLPLSHNALVMSLLGFLSIRFAPSLAGSRPCELSDRPAAAEDAVPPQESHATVFRAQAHT